VSVPTLWRAALVQTLAVAALSIAAAAVASHDFFEEWGWLIGPAAWMASAALTATVLKLPLPQALTGAVGAGLVSAVFVVTGVHWLGAACAVALFALWCARLRNDEVLPAEIV
jgi:hypothetical protein